MIFDFFRKSPGHEQVIPGFVRESQVSVKITPMWYGLSRFCRCKVESIVKLSLRMQEPEMCIEHLAV